MIHMTEHIGFILREYFPQMKQICCFILVNDYQYKHFLTWTQPNTIEHIKYVQI